MSDTAEQSLEAQSAEAEHLEERPGAEAERVEERLGAEAEHVEERPGEELLVEGETAEVDPELIARRDAALAQVRKFGDPILREKARPITVFDDALLSEVDRMGHLMHDGLGIGLAATQVGALRRLLVYRVQHDGPINALINPEIEWHSREEDIAPEGCLSLPKVHVEVERPTHIRVRAQNPVGAWITLEASGLEARVVQHEMDHLNGILILKRTTREERKVAMRTLREWQDSQGA